MPMMMFHSNPSHTFLAANHVFETAELPGLAGVIGLPMHTSELVGDWRLETPASLWSQNSVSGDAYDRRDDIRNKWTMARTALPL
jgi:hypothetical protein